MEHWGLQYGSDTTEVHPISDELGEYVISDVDPDNVYCIEKREKIAYLITNAPKLLQFGRNFFEWHANHFDDFNSEVNGELLVLANEIEPILQKMNT